MLQRSFRPILRWPKPQYSAWTQLRVWGATGPALVRHRHKQVKADGTVVEVGLAHWKQPQEGAAERTPLDPLDPLETSEKDADDATMLKYIAEVQRQHGDAVVLTQVGSFMELYFEQAVVYSAQLNIRLALKNQRNPLTGEPTVPMAGFPLSRLDYYEKVLVQDLGRTVVVLMQNPEEVAASGRERAKRPVDRILTKGTLLAEPFVAQDLNNYLLAIHARDATTIALTWVDLADGAAHYTVCTLDEVGNDLARISPSEVVVGPDASVPISEVVQRYLPHVPLVTAQFPPADQWSAYKGSLDRYKMDVLPHSVRKAFAGLVAYIGKCMPGSRLKLEPPTLNRSGDYMQLDMNARTALDLLTRTGTQGRPAEEGSLLSVVRRTRTPSGSRLLQARLMAPLVAPDAIRRRQDQVQRLLDQPASALRILQTYLGEMPDGSRVLQKMSMRRLDPVDLVTIANSVMTLRKLNDYVKSLDPSEEILPNIDELLEGPLKIASEILKAIDINSIAITNGSGGNGGSDGGGNGGSGSESHESVPDGELLSSVLKDTSDYKPVLRPGVNKALRGLYARLNEFQAQFEQINSSLPTLFGPTAVLKWHKQHKFAVYIKKPSPVLIAIRTGEVPGHVITELKSGAYILYDEWARLGNACTAFSNDLRLEEQRQLDAFCKKLLKQHAPSLRKAYALVDELDVNLSMATLAMEKRLVRPEIVADSSVFDIRQGRHITVEAGIAVGGHTSHDFVANDCLLTAEQPVAMITGPNMGGKSTYIRQAAIIALLAHIGSYVPCESAVIGVVDRIFCRIGAGDDLYRGRSTFMLEMLETSTILNHATHRSLAILDEVGRGTSVKESEAIAYATIKYLAHEKTCRTLFATHYGPEIWRHLESPAGNGSSASIQCLRSSAAVIDNELEFDYILRPGISDTSCALLVAQMAGFPAEAIYDAEQIAGPQ